MVPNGFISESEIPDELGARKIFLQGLSGDKFPVMIVQTNRHFAASDQIQFKSNSLPFFKFSSIPIYIFFMKRDFRINHVFSLVNLDIFAHSLNTKSCSVSTLIDLVGKNLIVKTGLS